MRMHRQHFRLIAEVIRDSGEPPETQLRWARQFVSALRATNPNFDTAKFLAAAAPEPADANVDTRT